MARLRERESAGAGSGSLGALLRAETFRLGPRTARVAQNLGERADEGARAWIGHDLPPLGAPSVTLGEARGTLGPHSFGFLDNHRGVAAYAGVLARPPAGGVAIVCGRREALPEVAPLAAARGLGVSWIISVGDGDAQPALEFLAADAATRAVLLAAPAADAASVAAAGKPVVLLGGDPLARAAARRSGGAAVDGAADLELWIAHGLILSGGPARRPAALVAGGGASLLAEAAAAAGLALPIAVVDEEEPAEIDAALGGALAGADLLLLAGVTLPPSSPSPTMAIDLGQPERVRALCAALAAQTAPPEPPIPRVRADRPAADAILVDGATALSDHDTKRLLKAYGVRVSRQAPAASATAAQRVATQIGFPVDVVGEERSAPPRRATTAAELKRAASLLLDGATYVLVRETFPAAPRAALAVRRQKGLGLVAHLGGERALLPLERPDALVLARAAGGVADRALIDLLARATAAAVERDLTLEIELFVGDEPAVVAASARR